MKKKVVIIIIVILVIFSGVIYFISSFKKDQNRVLENIDRVNTYYNSFLDNVSKINEVRHKYSNIISNTYVDDLDKNNDDIVIILDEYKDYINNILEVSEKLGKLCSNYYADSSVNQKCLSYNATIESINVYFKSDVDGYNDMVSKYNEKSGNKIDKYDVGKQEIIWEVLK